MDEQEYVQDEATLRAIADRYSEDGFSSPSLAGIDRVLTAAAELSIGDGLPSDVEVTAIVQRIRDGVGGRQYGDMPPSRVSILRAMTYAAEVTA